MPGITEEMFSQGAMTADYSAVAELTSELCPVPVERVGVRDSFGVVGKTEYLMRRFALTAEDIVNSAMRVLERKRTEDSGRDKE